MLLLIEDQPQNVMNVDRDVTKPYYIAMYLIE